MKFHILIYGCQMNYSDSARLKAVLLTCGFKYEKKIEDADIVIFDTCSVRQKSEDKIFGMLQDIPKNKKIWITGCMVGHNLNTYKNAYIQNNTNSLKKGNFIGSISTQKPHIIGIQDIEKLENVKKQFIDKEHLEFIFINHAFDPLFKKIKKKFSNLEALFRIDDVGFLPSILEELGYNTGKYQQQIDDYTKIIPSGSNQLFSQDTKTAFVPIQTGCSQFCSYCIVPYARGLEKNRPLDEIIKEIQIHVNNGIKEIVLLGQIVNKHPDFEKILKESLKIKGLKWLRYTSPYPTYYNQNIFKMHENEQNLCPQIHIPVQSGSNNILKKMFRGYNIEQFKGFIDQIRGLNRPISITTDIIVGFSDETDQDFQDTLDITNYSRFDMIYIGIYSPRPGTHASKKYDDNIPANIKQQRWKILTDQLKQISKENNQTEIGLIKELTINKINKDTIFGYTDNLKNIIIKTNNTKEYLIGDFIKAKIIDGTNFKLKGEII